MGQYESRKVRRRKQIARQHLCQKFSDRAVGVVDFAKIFLLFSLIDITIRLLCDGVCKMSPKNLRRWPRFFGIGIVHDHRRSQD